MKVIKWYMFLLLVLFFNVMPVESEQSQGSKIAPKIQMKNMVPSVMTDYGVFQRIDSFRGGNIFAFLVEVEEDYFFRKNSQNVAFMMPLPEDIETKYREKILTLLQSIFTEDRVHDVEVNIKLEDVNASKIIDRITVRVNIDGRWKIKYDDKNRPIISSDGLIERVYIPISQEDLRQTQILIQDVIGYNSIRGDMITIQNIPFDRTIQFAFEDLTYLQRQKKQTILLWRMGLIITCSICCSVFWVIYKSRKSKVKNSVRHNST